MKPVTFLFTLVLVASVTHDAQAGIVGNVREKRSKEFWLGVRNRIGQFKQEVGKAFQGLVQGPPASSTGLPSVTSEIPGFSTDMSVDDILDSLNSESTPQSEVDSLLNSLDFDFTAASTRAPIPTVSISTDSNFDDLLDSLNLDD